MVQLMTESIRMDPKIRRTTPKAARVLSTAPYWWSDAEWGKIAETTVDEQTIYLSKIRRNDSDYINYNLYIENCDRPDVAYYIGTLEFGISSGRDTAKVILADIISSWQRKGLGKFMYKNAINDLFTVEGVTCVRSDTARSVDAERVWESICRTAEGKVYKVPHETGGGGFVFETRGPVPIRRRPPVPVRQYRRQV